MFYDLMYQLGGEFLVRLSELFVGPLFAFVCTMSELLDGSWTVLATMLEKVLS